MPPAEEIVSQREYDAFKLATSERINDLHSLVQSHFAEDAEAFKEIKANVKEVDIAVRKLNDSTIAVAASQTRIELQLQTSERERKTALDNQEKKRNLRLTFIAIAVTFISPLLSELLHRVLS